MAEKVSSFKGAFSCPKHKDGASDFVLFAESFDTAASLTTGMVLFDLAVEWLAGLCVAKGDDTMEFSSADVVLVGWKRRLIAVAALASIVE